MPPPSSCDSDSDSDLTETERGKKEWSLTEGDLQVLSLSLPFYHITIEAEIASPTSTSIQHTTSPSTQYQHRYLHTTGMDST